MLTIPALGVGPTGDSWSVLGGEELLPAIGTPVLLAYGTALVAEPQPEHELDRWRAVAAEVVRCNSRLIVFGVQTGDRSLPPPLDATGLPPETLLEGARTRDGRLAEARRRFQRVCADEAMRLLLAATPTIGDPALGKAAELTRGGGQAESVAALGVRIRRRLAVLEPETPTNGRVVALELAARALATTSVTAATALTDRLATTVRSLNAETRRRRDQALLAAAYLQVMAIAPRQPLGDWIMRRLVAVLHGRAEFGADLRDDAERLRVQFEERAEQEYLRHLVQAHFDSSGLPLRVDELTVPPGIMLSGLSGRVLVTAGEVTGGPPLGGTASRAFTDAFIRLRLLLGRRPVWNPAVFP